MNRRQSPKRDLEKQSPLQEVSYTEIAFEIKSERRTKLSQGRREWWGKVSLFLSFFSHFPTVFLIVIKLNSKVNSVLTIMIIGKRSPHLESSWVDTWQSAKVARHSLPAPFGNQLPDLFNLSST